MQSKHSTLEINSESMHILRGGERERVRESKHTEGNKDAEGRERVHGNNTIIRENISCKDRDREERERRGESWGGSYSHE